MKTEEQKRREQIINKGQLAISETCDLKENTWTFQMIGNDYAIRAGEFIIIPKEEFDKLK